MEPYLVALNEAIQKLGTFFPLAWKYWFIQKYFEFFDFLKEINLSQEPSY